jgi:hypothetical protein
MIQRSTNPAPPPPARRTALAKLAPAIVPAATAIAAWTYFAVLRQDVPGLIAAVVLWTVVAGVLLAARRRRRW